MQASGIEFLTVLEDVIRERLRSAAAGSYTAELVGSGQRRVAQKVGEEAVELALASIDGDRDETIGEAADLLYHVLVLLNNQDIRLADIVAALESRHTA